MLEGQATVKKILPELADALFLHVGAEKLLALTGFHMDDTHMAGAVPNSSIHTKNADDLSTQCDFWYCK